jgi:hypothetical protein
MQAPCWFSYYAVPSTYLPVCDGVIYLKGHWALDGGRPGNGLPVRTDLQQWIAACRPPSGFGNDVKKILSGTKTNKHKTVAIKSHGSHVFIDSGLASLAASWKDAAGNGPSSRMSKFVRALQEIHRCLVRHVLKPSVSNVVLS